MEVITHPCGSVTYDLETMYSHPSIEASTEPAAESAQYSVGRWVPVAAAATAVVLFPEIALISAVATVAGAGLVWLWNQPTGDCEPDYQIGPRGGRYTVEDSMDGGTYRRYR